MTANPYAPPQAHVEDVSAADSAAEAIRREHIQHETSVRGIGSLYYLSGGLLVVAAVGALAAIGAAPTSEAMAVGVVSVVLYAIFGTLFFVVARGLRRLRSGARTGAIVISGIGLLGFPVGTVINGYFLYLLLSAKGKRIFAPDYAAIVAATPHVKYRTSVATWIVLGALVLVLIALVVIGITAG